MPYLFLLFILMPIVEIAVLIQVGGSIGVLPTLAIVILTAVIGTAMLRQQGSATLQRARSRLDQGEMPADQIVEGLLLVIGGVLLLTPGFVTDALGFACLLPMSRQWLASRLGHAVLTRVQVIGVNGGAAPGQPAGRGPGPAGPHPRRPTPGVAAKDSGEVIEGDYRKID